MQTKGFRRKAPGAGGTGNGGVLKNAPLFLYARDERADDDKTRIRGSVVMTG